MSQSSKTLHEFGSLSIKEDLRLKTGSTSALSATVTPAPTTLADADATVTVAQLRTGILVMTPSVTRTVTLPTATLTADFLSAVGESFDFHVINLTATDAVSITMAAGTGGSIVGFADVRDSVATSNADSGSATFRIRQTGVDTPAYVVYRLV